MDARRARPLRAELAFTYAGIALLTAVLLGGILLLVLNAYYAKSETEYLQVAAARVLELGIPGSNSSPEDLQRWAIRAAVTAQARVRLYASDGTLAVDSGPTQDLDPGVLTGEPRVGEGRHEGLPRPLGNGLFGGTSTATSGRTLRVSPGPGRYPSSYVELSEAPASSKDVIYGVAQAWTLAAVLAVALAALAGYLLSSRISKPLAALTQASDRMAEGDLSARAPATSGHEFGRLADSFNTMAERNETTVVSLRRFVADAAHQIGTPLTALEADLELAEKAASTDDERRLVLRALGQARRLEALSQGLLRLSRIEAGDATEFASVDLAALVRGAVDGIASRAEQAELMLDVIEVAEPLVVAADHAKLQVVLDSLLDNAVKFTPPGGTISVVAIREGSDAVVSITDTGVGIPVAEQEAVFSRFHRGRNVAAIPGSGLGLAIVKATVERLGGTVAFESRDGGTRFSVRLPLAVWSAGHEPRD